MEEHYFEIKVVGKSMSEKLVYPECRSTWDLAALVRKPRIEDYRGGCFYDDWQEGVKKWKSRVVTAFEEGLKEIGEADGKGQTIPRSSVLKLAVATNLLREAGSGWNNHKEYALGLALCEKFGVKGLATATDWYVNPFTKRTKLEEVLGAALRRKGEVHCRICGRLLTNVQSVQRGIGPECYKKIGVHGPSKGAV